ncbi:MAG: hypothetical protein EHM61_20465, partial [Acidobacteria bacterium]
LGYLVTFYVQEAGCRFSSAVLIDNYQQNRHVAEPDDWTVFLEDEGGDAVWQSPVDNPRLFSPLVHAAQPIPFTIKIPGVTARTLRLRDHHGTTVLQMALDDRFISQARSNRTRFLEHDKQNREAVRRLSESRRNVGQNSPRPVFQSVEELREPGDWLFEQELPELIEQVTRPNEGFEHQATPRLLPFPTTKGPTATPEPVTTRLINGIVRNKDGATLAGASVLLRNLASTTPIGAVWSKSTNSAGQYSFFVPSNFWPTSFVLCVSASGYVRQSVAVWVTDHVMKDFVLEAGITVSGKISDDQGKPVTRARIRASAAGAFADSALSTSDGSYSFALAPGTYDFEVLPPDQNTPSAYQQGVSISQSPQLNFSLPAQRNSLVVRLFYPDNLSLSATQTFPKRFEVERAGTLVAVIYGVRGPAEFHQEKNRYFVPYTLSLEPGEYDLTCYPVGHDPVRIQGVNVKDQTTVDADLGSVIMRSGVLRGADGTPLPNIDVRSYDDLTSLALVVRTDPQGRFAIPVTPNGLMRFSADAGSRNILGVERLGPVLQNRVEDCVLSSFPAFQDSGGVLTQIYGTSDRTNRQNIVILGDGYTGVNETFTDQNGNGQWDGTIYYDLNNDGLWNTGEPYWNCGDKRLAPTNGTNPTLQNEPFNDLNGDGVLSTADQEVFDQNCLDIARSFFGQDFWRDKADAFNIFRIRIVSRQAGHDIKDRAGNVLISRDTPLGTFLADPDRNYILNADASLVASYINQYVPEMNIKIVLINQPITMGRATSFILLQGGNVFDLQNRVTVAHEAGHNPGRLADEYTEYQSNYVGNDLMRPNVTTLADPDLIPWRSFLTPGKEIPSVPGSSGIGLFEGANYYTGGCYKPAYNCTMVSGNRFCPVCEHALEVRLLKLTGKFPVAVPYGPSGPISTLRPIFRWQPQTGVSGWMIEIEPLDGKEVSQIYEVYATSFQPVSALAARTLHRWRLRAGAESSWGAWSEWVYFRTRERQERSPGTTVR